MEKETIKNIFKFLEDEGEHKAPFKWKLENNIPFSKEELEVDGDLDLYGSKIEQLPEGLKIGRDLNLQYSTMSSLPKGLKVYGDLNIDVSVLSKLSDEEISEMIEPGFVEGKIHRQ